MPNGVITRIRQQTLPQPAFYTTFRANAMHHLPHLSERDCISSILRLILESPLPLSK